jgi:hypothetical protein
MNLDAVLSMRDSDALKSALARAGQQKQTTEQMLAQRVSFVFASVSEKSGVTKDQVRKVIVGQTAGTTATA